MIDAANSERARVRRRNTALLLWIGFLVPLGAWMIQLFSLYMLEDFVSCTPGSLTPGVIFGIGVPALALSITAALGLLTIATGILSFRLWRKLGGPGAEDQLSAPRWMALAGVLNSILFASIILIKVAPPLILGVCERPL